MNKHVRAFIRDVELIFLSVCIAVLLVNTGILPDIIASTKSVAFLSSLVSGFFFTSIFTTAPAIAALGEISKTDPVLAVAFFGAIGAMLGDLIIFRFMRDTFSRHLSEITGTRGFGRRFRSLLKLRSFRWMTFLVGGLVIASPLPDEVGLSLLGFSKVKTSWFLPLSFAFNFLGILLVGVIARSSI